MASRKLEVTIVGNSSDLQRAFKDASGASSTFGDKLAKASRGAFVALGALGAGAGFAVKSASDLGEQISKTGVVFGESAPAIQKWAETTASSIGISNRAALEAAGTFGNMLVPMGLARGKSAEMSQSMVKLAADMASFNNASPEQVLEALRSGLSGETEPLRQFGVFLNEAGVKAKAMALGLWDGHGALSESAKAQARYALILAQSKDAQGDFGRTSGSLANQQRLLKAELEDVAAKLGAALLPAMQQLASNLQRATAFASEHTTAVKVVSGALAALAAGVLVVSGAVKAWAVIQGVARAATLAWTAAQWLLNAALTANPVGIVIVAVAALAAGLVIAWRNSETFRNIVTAALNTVKETAKTVSSAVVSAIEAITAAFNAVVSAIRSIVSWIARIPRSINIGINLPKLPNIPGFAHGVENFGGGLAVVGERGPELVNLPPGSSVRPAGSFASGRGGGDVNVNVNVDGALLGSTVPEVAQTIRKELLRTQGRNSNLFA